MSKLSKLLDQLEDAIPELRALDEEAAGTEEGEEMPLEDMPEEEADEELPMMEDENADDLDMPPMLKGKKKPLPF